MTESAQWADSVKKELVQRFLSLQICEIVASQLNKSFKLYAALIVPFSSKIVPLWIGLHHFKNKSNVGIFKYKCIH